MSDLKYFVYKGFGETGKKDTHYSQAVRVGDRVITSGQGGWIRDPFSLPDSLEEQIKNAFDNIDHTLKVSGLEKGFEHVYMIRTYNVGWKEEHLELIVAQLKKWCPNHEPVWTALGVEKLALPAMKIEIEVEAYAG